MENMEGVIALFIPIAVCVVLPVLVVWIVFRAKINSDNKRTEVLIKAIESNNDIDTDKLAEAMSRPRKTALETLNERLLYGCMFALVGFALLVVWLVRFFSDCESFSMYLVFGLASIAVGASYLVVYFVTRGQVKDKNK